MNLEDMPGHRSQPSKSQSSFGSSEQEVNTKGSDAPRIAYVQLPSLANVRQLQKRRQDHVDPQDIDQRPEKRIRSNEEVPINATHIPRASLLGLPAELRNRIYSYIWPGDLIHVATRPCKPYSKGAWRTDFNKSSWAPQSRFVRWTHTICQVPDDWQRAYSLSKRPDSSSTSSSSLHPDSTFLQDTHTRHNACHLIQDSFVSQQYVTKCAHKLHPVHDPNYCDLHSKYVAEMTQIYGPASSGLKTLHSSSKLHLNILLTCHQLYTEARLLPYSLNTYQFDYPSTIDSFPSASGIRCLRIDGWGWNDTKTAIAAFSNMNRLEYSCNYSSGYCGRMKVAYDMLESLKLLKREERPRLKVVEVILGTDVIPRIQVDSRSVRRGQAREVEGLLMGREGIDGC